MTDEMAVDPIEETPHGETDALLERVRGMSSRRQLRAWLFPGAMLIAFVTAMVWLGTVGYLETAWPALAALAIIGGSGISIWIVAERREVRTIEALAACKELRALGGLLESANCTNRRARDAVHNTLGDLLPRLTENDAALLSTAQREFLNMLLYGKSAELAIAAFYALEQVGDGTALPYLTSIAAGKGIPPMLRGRQAEVQERARHTVEAIRERMERHNRASVLLRAAQVPEAPSGQLVRPAHNRPLVDGQELLRPEAGDEHNSG